MVIEQSNLKFFALNSIDLILTCQSLLPKNCAYLCDCSKTIVKRKLVIE